MNLSLTLGVADLERTETFYREVLKLDIQRRQPSPGMPDILFIRQGTGTILFRELDILQARHPAIFESLDRHPLGLGVTIDLEIPQIARLYNEIEHRKIHTLYELQDDESGWQELWLHDPDGYLLVLSQAP